jgi:predicted DNA-binding protein with PD1-like motif
MKSKLVAQEADQRIFVLILDQGEEASAAITRFAEQEHLHGASMTALGAFERAKVGWFDPKAQEYRPTSVDQQCEVLSVVGDIATGDDGNPSLHIHVVLGLSDGTTRGRHLMEGVVRPTAGVKSSRRIVSLPWTYQPASVSPLPVGLKRAYVKPQFDLFAPSRITAPPYLGCF